MIEPTYILGFIGAATIVVTVLAVGTFAAAGLIFTGERKKAETPVRRPAATPARTGHRHGHAI